LRRLRSLFDRWNYWAKKGVNGTFERDSCSFFMLDERKHGAAKKFLLTAVVCVMVATTLPATAQVYLDADSGAVGGNRLDDPNYGWPHSHWRRGYDAFARGECRVIRERVVLPDGSVIYRAREVCG